MLIRSPDRSSATYCAFIAAARFCDGHTLKRPETVFGLKRPRSKLKVPVVMTANEVRRCLAAATCHRHRAIIMCAYDAGLSNGEVRHLRVADIDAALVRNSTTRPNLPLAPKIRQQVSRLRQAGQTTTSG